jgi:hypothetical protein
VEEEEEEDEEEEELQQQRGGGLGGNSCAERGWEYNALQTIVSLLLLVFEMKAVAAATATLTRFICSCFSALFGDFRLSAYDPVMQLIPPGELYSDIAAVASHFSVGS